MSLLAELNRRNVFRVAVGYVLLSWVLLQVAEVLFQVLDVPEWGLKLVFGILLLGFPVALILSWVYELTPEGLQRDSGVSSDPAHARRAGRRLTVMVLVLAGIAVSLAAIDRFVDKPASPALAARPEPVLATPSAPIADEASIAVLPFTALSDDADDAFFGKGIAEELLNALARFPDLKVAGRTSAFALDEMDANLSEVGERLGVAHILEGSVRRAGDRLRVTAQLIRVEDGIHLWSQNFDRTLTDVFAIQDEIVEALSRQLQVRLGVGGGAGRARRGDIDPQAYEQYLRGLALWGERDNPPSNRLDAIAALRMATSVAPNFAEAWAQLGAAYVFSSATPLGISPSELLDRCKTAVERALTLDDTSAAAHASAAAFHASYSMDFAAAAQHLQRALELGPNRAETHYVAARHYQIVGDVARAADSYNRALVLDPLNHTMRRVRAEFLVETGQWDDVVAYLDQCAKTRCMEGGTEAFAVVMLVLMGEQERARQWMTETHFFTQFARLDPDEQPSFFRFLVAFTDFAFGGSAQQLLAGFSEDPGPFDMAGLVAPFAARAVASAGEVIADSDRVDWIFDSLQKNYRDRSLLSEPFSTAPFYGFTPGYPSWVLEHPRYEAFWAQPGLAELARLRRSNGVDAGLPITAGRP